MKVKFFTPDGDVVIDTDCVSDEELQRLGLSRENLPGPVPDIYDIEARLRALEEKSA
jgi:hypothetical protein